MVLPRTERSQTRWRQPGNPTAITLLVRRFGKEPTLIQPALWMPRTACCRALRKEEVQSGSVPRSPYPSLQAQTLRKCSQAVDKGHDVLKGVDRVGDAGKQIGKVVSRIKDSPRLVGRAENAGRSVQRSLDTLVDQLSKGNLNPGMGTNGARVDFRQLHDGTIEILGKSTKSNQAEVIDEILERFGTQ